MPRLSSLKRLCFSRPLWPTLAGGLLLAGAGLALWPNPWTWDIPLDSQIRARALVMQGDLAESLSQDKNRALKTRLDTLYLSRQAQTCLTPSGAGTLRHLNTQVAAYGTRLDEIDRAIERHLKVNRAEEADALNSLLAEAAPLLEKRQALALKLDTSIASIYRIEKDPEPTSEAARQLVLQIAELSRRPTQLFSEEIDLANGEAARKVAKHIGHLSANFHDAQRRQDIIDAQVKLARNRRSFDCLAIAEQLTEMEALKTDSQQRLDHITFLLTGASSS